MSTPLLQTKLYIPSPRPDLVSRPRLIERLNAGPWQNSLQKGLGIAHKLTFVSAPTGFRNMT